MKRRHFSFILTLLLIFPVSLVMGQNIAGEYQLKVTGTNYLLEKFPEERLVSTTSTMDISQEGETITIEMGGIAGAMEPATFEGRVGNQLFTAIWWQLANPNQVKVISGEVLENGDVLEGDLMYPRIESEENTVLNLDQTRPGWLAARFKAVKKGADLAITEDCIEFENDALDVKMVEGNWRIIADGIWIKDFDDNKEHAETVLQIFKDYGINEQCFVGRPNPFFEYYLSDGQAPSGDLDRENVEVIEFNPEDLRVEDIYGDWKIMSGPEWILDFDHEIEQAHKALKIIRKYDFTHICRVGKEETYFTFLHR